MSIDHYTVEIPESASICSNWTSLIEEVHIKWGHCTLDKKYGGYVIEDEGTIVLVCNDDLCAILEERDTGSRVLRKYGGFVIEKDGVVVVACDEKMSEEAGRPEGLVDMLYGDIAEDAQSQDV